MTTPFAIRRASKNDTPLILQLIRELAEFEKLLHDVTADEATLRDSLFSDPKGPEVLIGEENGKPVGFVLYFYNFSTFLGKKGIYIEDLYVRAEFRSKGYGEALIKKICQIAKEQNCARIEWFVLDWNKRAIEFYKKMGAIPLDEWTVFRLTEKAIDQILSQ